MQRRTFSLTGVPGGKIEHDPPVRYHLVARRSPASRAEPMACDNRLGELIRKAKRLIEHNCWFAAVVNEITASGDTIAVYANADVGGPEQNVLTGGEVRDGGGQRVVS